MSVECTINGKTSAVAAGTSLFACAESMGVRVPTSCRKQGKCKECLVEVTAGLDCLSERVEEEAHLRENFRLSCRCQVITESGRISCHTMRRGDMRIERKAFHLPATSAGLKPNPAVTRDGARVLLDDREIDRSAGPLHGVAMDLGTTTVVLRLFDLESGEIVADASFENPQRFGGSDVLARIQYDTDHRGRLLQRVLLGYLSHALEELPVDPLSIYELIVAGNSTMRDLFFGLDVYSIGQNPYQSATELDMAAGKRADTSLCASAKQLHLPLHPQARVYGLPIISGHVGADAAACMLAVDLAQEARLIAIMDIGTNTELIVGNRDKILAASCPAGPAFEGGNITCGMPGLPGAIEGVTLEADGSFVPRVIGGGPPAGICGSGLIELLSELRRNGRMNAMGRFSEDQQAFVITAPGQEPIVFHERDVNELAQAKGANVAGLHVVMNSYGIRFKDIEAFYLAGGFGRHIDIAAAKRIGLIPNIADERIHQVGNAAIEGASIALLSKKKRSELETLVRRVTHCRLEADPGFFDYFVEGCQFNPIETYIA